MAGKIKEMIELIVEHRSRGNPALARITKAKICLKGINPEKYTPASEDNPQVMEKLKILARELNINFEEEN